MAATVIDWKHVVTFFVPGETEKTPYTFYRVVIKLLRGWKEEGVTVNVNERSIDDLHGPITFWGHVIKRYKDTVHSLSFYTEDQIAADPTMSNMRTWSRALLLMLIRDFGADTTDPVYKDDPKTYPLIEFASSGDSWSVEQLLQMGDQTDDIIKGAIARVEDIVQVSPGEKYAEVLKILKGSTITKFAHFAKAQMIRDALEVTKGDVEAAARLLLP